MKKSIIFHMAPCLMVINLIMLTFFLPIANTQAVTSKKASLNHKHIILNVGEKQKLSIKNYNKLIKWKSSNKKVATVSKKGVVRAVKKGKANISAKIKGKKYICKVTVKAENITTKSQNTLNGTITETTVPASAGKTDVTPIPTEIPDVNPTPTETPEASLTPPEDDKTYYDYLPGSFDPNTQRMDHYYLCTVLEIGEHYIKVSKNTETYYFEYLTQPTVYINSLNTTGSIFTGLSYTGKTTDYSDICVGDYVGIIYAYKIGDDQRKLKKCVSINLWKNGYYNHIKTGVMCKNGIVTEIDDTYIILVSEDGTKIDRFQFESPPQDVHYGSTLNEGYEYSSYGFGLSNGEHCRYSDIRIGDVIDVMCKPAYDLVGEPNGYDFVINIHRRANDPVNPNPTTTPEPARTPSPTSTPLKDYDYYPFTTPKSDNYIPGQLIISLITNCTEEEVLDIAKTMGVKNVESVELVFSELKYMYYINLTTKTKESVVDAIHLIQEHPLVYYAIPVYNSFMIDDWE